LGADRFRELFTDTGEVIFAFHGYARALHQLVHGRPNDQRFHVHGFTEQGTTTTPFDMVVLNEMSRYHLALHAIDRLRTPPPKAAELAAHCNTMLERHHHYVREHFQDMPEIRDWVWPF
jgi:xylulose-5-phosphate/fructose-6-phosphate phosphoketolase